MTTHLLLLLVLVFAISATVGVLVSLIPVPTWLLVACQITAAFAVAALVRRQVLTWPISASSWWLTGAAWYDDELCEKVAVVGDHFCAEHVSVVYGDDE